jgi:hypothetical protein
MQAWHPFLEEFRAEHEWILEVLVRAETTEEWRRYFKYAREEVLELHEKSEELFLFSAVATRAEIRNGGPLCTLYYDMYLHRRPLETAAAAIGSSYLDPRKLADATTLPFFAAGSPVCIPVEDHMALEAIIKAADSVVEGNDAELAQLAATHLRLLRIHFEKENTCLFPLCRNILSDEELNLWAEKRARWKASQYESRRSHSVLK